MAHTLVSVRSTGYSDRYVIMNLKVPLSVNAIDNCLFIHAGKILNSQGADLSSNGRQVAMYKLFHGKQVPIKQWDVQVEILCILDIILLIARISIIIFSIASSMEITHRT